MFYTVYKTTNNVNSKTYIGVHKTRNPLDTYLGSGIALKQSIQKYGRAAFSKEILFTFDTKEEAYAKEKELVILSETSYNLVGGGSISPDWSDQRKEISSKRHFGSDNHMYGKKQTEESNRRRSETLKGRKMPRDAVERSAAFRRGRPSPLKGKPLSEEHRRKQSESKSKTPLVTCTYCQKTMSPQNLGKWHGQRCSSLRSIG